MHVGLGHNFGFIGGYGIEGWVKRKTVIEYKFVAFGSKGVVSWSIVVSTMHPVSVVGITPPVSGSLAG